MTVKQLKSIIQGLPDDYEVRADVDYETHLSHIETDLTVKSYEIAHECKCLFLECSD